MLGDIVLDVPPRDFGEILWQAVVVLLVVGARQVVGQVVPLDAAELGDVDSHLLECQGQGADAPTCGEHVEALMLLLLSEHVENYHTLSFQTITTNRPTTNLR